MAALHVDVNYGAVYI